METWNIECLKDIRPEHAAVLVTPSVSPKTAPLPFRTFSDLDALPGDLKTLIVVGGGTLIDKAKLWRFEHAPDVSLVAIPSIWGSGAEVSPVAVINRNGGKEIHVDARLVPDQVCIWPELAESIPEKMACHACGDAWSHVIEGFLSPLADENLQAELASLIQLMLELPISNDIRWFEASARACAGQARSSVGLVHGVAHVLEGYLRQNFPDSEWGHARLCAVFLWPVMEFNCLNSGKWLKLAKHYGIDSRAVFSTLKQLHEPKAYNQAMPLLDRHWMQILKDPCSRTNSCLVRPASKDFFLEKFLREQAAERK